MYDENDSYNQVTGTIKNTAKTTLNAAKTVHDLTKKLQAGKDMLATADLNFVFTGQSTDLSYFANNDVMPIQLIERIPDETLKNAVKDEFNKAALDGKLEIDSRAGTVKITKKGKQFINKPEFKKAAAVNVQKATEVPLQAQEMSFGLNGTMQDLNYFRYSDTLDLNTIFQNPDVETVKKVAANLTQMRESGLIVVENSAAKLTEKGAQLLGDELFKAATASASASAATSATAGAAASAAATGATAGAGVAAGAAGGIPGVIVVAAVKIAGAAVNSVSNGTIRQ